MMMDDDVDNSIDGKEEVEEEESGDGDRSSYFFEVVVSVGG